MNSVNSESAFTFCVDYIMRTANEIRWLHIYNTQEYWPSKRAATSSSEEKSGMQSKNLMSKFARKLVIDLNKTTFKQTDSTPSFLQMEDKHKQKPSSAIPLARGHSSARTAAPTPTHSVTSCAERNPAFARPLIALLLLLTCGEYWSG